MREFNTREAEGNYSITFETDDRKAFEKVQEFCRMLIDGKDCEAIPVGWIERYMESVGRIGYVEVMLDDWKAEQWKKENGTCK